MKALGLVILAGCWTTSQSTTSTPPTGSVAVELAAVNLGDDCGDDATSVPPPVAQLGPRPAITRAPGEAPSPTDRAYRQNCDPTSMQLSLRASEGTGSTPVRVKKVELLDRDGGFLAVLEARTPLRWDGESYVGWTEMVEAGRTLNASYLLSSPDWNKLTNGRWLAHTKTFQLRVTLAIGAADRTVDKQSITPAMIDPPVPT